GIPNISAEALRTVISAFRKETGHSRVKICCDHSIGLLQSVRSGYLDLAFLFADETDMAGAVTSWPEDLVWVRASDFVLNPDEPVPLVSSPNWLVPDRRGAQAPPPAHRPFQHRFSAFSVPAR